jgi:septation ring formation regulator EzrA
LQQIISTINIFVDVDECIDFITDIKEEKIFMIVSGVFNPVIISFFQDISQVSCVYIFGQNQTSYENWAQQWPKVKDAYADM